MNTKIILCEDVENLGSMGDTVSVAPGYARNFLLPRRLAVSADSASAKQIEHEMRIIRKREARRNKELAGVLETLEGVTIEFTAKVGEEGKLYGSITTLHIAQKLAEAGHEIDRKKLILAEPIKSLGEHSVGIRLANGVQGALKVVVTTDVEPESEPEAAQEATEEPAVEESESAPEEESTLTE